MLNILPIMLFHSSLEIITLFPNYSVKINCKRQKTRNQGGNSSKFNTMNSEHSHKLCIIRTQFISCTAALKKLTFSPLHFQLYRHITLCKTIS